jgi:hypothetical protein
VRLSYIRFLLQHLSVDAWNPSTARDLAVPTALGKKNCDQEKAYQDRCSSPFFAIHHGAPALGPSPAWRAAANRRHPREFVSQLSSRTATPTKSLIIFSSLQSVGKPNCAGCALWSLFFSMSASAFAMPAPAGHVERGPVPRFRDIPDVSRNAEANPQVPSTEQGSQSWDVTGQINDPARSEAH